ncbi:MAG: translation initiation factor [Cyanobacteriota bacterium]
MARKGGWQEFSSNGVGTGPNGRRTSTAPATAPASSGDGGRDSGTPRPRQTVRVQRTRAGKGGKLVTTITGLEIPEAEARSLLKTLKASAGTGGTLKDGVIELQGDQLAAALAALEREGFRPKQAGG